MIPVVRHLYVHVPFCARRCSYCDFSIAVRRVVPVEEFLTGIEQELRLRLPGSPPVLDTLYLGGGTPSRLGGEGVVRLIDLIRRRAILAPDAEVTIEANPEDVTPERGALWRAAGVNRLSLGAQSFDRRALEWMHRTHTAEDTARAVDAARQGGIANLSLDLIFALPRELDRDWERDVQAALALEPSHLSLYGLTVEPGTPLGRWRARGEVEEAPEERFEEEFLAADGRLAASGFEHYEVSNYARDGARSRHNAAYWSRAPYLGIGPAAHSFDGQARWWSVSPYVEWARRLRAGGDPLEGREVLRDEQVEAERVYLGLRTARGHRMTEEQRPIVARWVYEGWAVVEGDAVRLTPLGWLRLDALAATLTPIASRS